MNQDDQIKVRRPFVQSLQRARGVQQLIQIGVAASWLESRYVFTVSQTFRGTRGSSLLNSWLNCRLPISMTLLSITFVIVHVKHSYTLAGTVATGAALISTVFSPTWSRYADRLGQRKVLRFTVPFYISFDLIFLIAITKHAPTYIWMSAIFLAEVFLPNIGGLIRRRWLWSLGEDRVMINTAYSYEALMDEIIFIVGPLVATSAATFISPASGMILGFSFMAIGTTLFISQRSTEPAPFRKEEGEKHGLILMMPVIQAVFLPFIFIGAFFSSTNLIVVGYSQQHHDTAYTGLVLAIWAAGSGVAAIFNGSIKWRISDAITI
ncbi:MAG: MFS transporter [Actinomycetota bacterium]